VGEAVVVLLLVAGGAVRRRHPALTRDATLALSAAVPVSQV